MDFASGTALAEIGVRCFQGSGFREFRVPASVRAIGDGAFSLCGDLARVTFAEGSALEEVGVQAFARSGLEAFVAPAGLRVVGRAAFRGCKAMYEVRAAGGSAAVVAGKLGPSVRVISEEAE